MTTSPTLGFFYTFRVPDAERERLPVLTRHVLGRAIELHDQVGTVRLKSGDRIKLTAILNDGCSVLCEHSGVPGLLLTELRWLEDCEQP